MRNLDASGFLWRWTLGTGPSRSLPWTRWRCTRPPKLSTDCITGKHLSCPSGLYKGILKGGEYRCTSDLLFDWFGLVYFANKNKNCQLSYSWLQTSQTGGQQYSDTSPFSIPCCLYHQSFMIVIYNCSNTVTVNYNWKYSTHGLHKQHFNFFLAYKWTQ